MRQLQLVVSGDVVSLHSSVHMRHAIKLVFISRLTVRWMRYKTFSNLQHMIESLTVVMRSSVYKGVDRASAEPCFINLKLSIGQTSPPQSRKPRLTKASSTPNRVGTVGWYYQGHQDRELLPVSTRKARVWICKPGVLLRSRPPYSFLETQLPIVILSFTF